MDKRTYQNIAENASLIVSYANLPSQLRRATGRIVGETKKEIETAIATLEQSTQLFNPPLHRALQVYRLVVSDSLSVPQIAENLECSESTVKQTIGALRAGGVQIVSEQIPVIPAAPRSGLGPEETNTNADNEERMQEAIKSVKLAVKKLRQEHDWDTLNTRQKIRLLQQETRAARGTAISSQTLYREWIKDLW